MVSCDGGLYHALWLDKLTISVINKTFSHGGAAAFVSVDQTGTAVPVSADTNTADPSTAPDSRPDSAGAAAGPTAGATGAADPANSA